MHIKRNYKKLKIGKKEEIKEYWDYQKEEKLLFYQMPTFFFISGYLFVRSSLFNKTYKEIILSKINRLIVPYFFILFVMFCIKFSTPSEMLLRPIEMSPIYIIEMIFDKLFVRKYDTLQI